MVAKAVGTLYCNPLGTLHVLIVLYWRDCGLMETTGRIELEPITFENVKASLQEARFLHLVPLILCLQVSWLGLYWCSCVKEYGNHNLEQYCLYL